MRGAERALTFENIHKLRIRSVDCHKLPPLPPTLSLLLFAACATTHDNKSCNRLHTHAHTLAHHKAAKGSSDPSMIYNHAAAARFPRPAIKATSCGRVCSLSVCFCCVDNRRKIVTFPWSLSSDSAANRKSARENFSKATS